MHNALSTTEPLPQSPLACLPWLWKNRLFPGTPPKETDWSWVSLVILLILPAIGLYPCTSFALFEPDEGRYAQIPREMFERGEWLVPFLQSEPYLDKPPLFYWLVVISYHLFGVSDWAARLVPALAVHGAVLACYFFGRRIVGERQAFWGALLLSVAPGFVGMARLLLLDGVLTLLVTLAIFTAYEAIGRGVFYWRWWLLTAFICGLGVLCKGPVILVLLLLPLVLQQVLVGPFLLRRWRHWTSFFGIVLVMALPWYIAICFAVPEFGYHFLWKHNVLRFLQPFDHIEPVWYFLPILWGSLLPFSLWSLDWLFYLASGQEEKRQTRHTGQGYLMLCGFWCFFFFSLSGSKLPTYILPAMPPLCLAFASYWVARQWQKTHLLRGAFLFAYAFVLFGNYWLVPFYADYRSPMNNGDLIQRLCADPATPVICYPRQVNSVAFYVGRDDLKNYRSKDTGELIEFLRNHQRIVVLFGHRHSPDALRQALPKNYSMVLRAPMGLCEVGVIERRNE